MAILNIARNKIGMLNGYRSRTVGRISKWEVRLLNMLKIGAHCPLDREIEKIDDLSRGK